MKYFIWAAFLVVGMSAGLFGGGWAFKTTFHDMSGVTWTQFTDGYAACEKAAGERCNMYGGFAPLSQFRGQ